MSRFKRSEIAANQDYLKEWDDYQVDFLNGEDFDPKNSDERALLLPISVDIDDGVIKRHRIQTPQLTTLWDKAKSLINDDSAWAYKSYMTFFEPIDGQQSGAPSTPLDFDLNSRVYMMCHLPRANWTFTDHTQFSVDNIPKGHLKDAFEVVGIFDEGHGLLVHNKNWQKPGKKTFLAKYNLHVSIHQSEKNNKGKEVDMRTDIIIDPGSRGNQRP